MGPRQWGSGERLYDGTFPGTDVSPQRGLILGEFGPRSGDPERSSGKDSPTLGVNQVPGDTPMTLRCQSVMLEKAGPKIRSLHLLSGKPGFGSCDQRPRKLLEPH